MNDLISVIVPVYNVEQYLERCMESILNQTYRNLEIILVDDNSKDNSKEICLQYLKDPRVVLVQHSNNKGLSGARNSGLNIAKGEYVVFVDSDDYAESTMIENLYCSAIETNADTVIGGFRRKIGNHIDIKDNIFAGSIYDTSEDIKNNVLKKMFASNGIDHIEMSVWKVLFSMDIIRNKNFRFPDKKYLCEDIIFDFGYYLSAKKVAMCSDTSYCYCLNDQSLSQIYQKNKFDRINFQASEMRRLASEVGFDQDAFIRIDNFYIGNLLHHMKTMVACVDNIGKKECIKEIRFICADNKVEDVHWNEIDICFKGRDKIPFKLMKNQKTQTLYYYFRLLTSIRKIVRG